MSARAARESGSNGSRIVGYGCDAGDTLVEYVDLRLGNIASEDALV